MTVFIRSYRPAMRSNIARTWASSSTPEVGEAEASPGVVEATTGYCSIDRNLTRFWNCVGFCCASFLNVGIGAVGLISVERIASADRSEPMCVSGGPGPLLPLDPITWHERH